MSWREGLNTILDNAIRAPRSAKAIVRRAERNVLFAAEQYVAELANPLPDPVTRRETRDQLVRQVNQLRGINA